jgi:histidyl-tRNA synthetase
MRQMPFTLAAMSESEKYFRAPRGTRDILPPESFRWHEVLRRALESFALAGYAPIETPIFEHTEVFERGVGESSDVVTKQMYTFTDRGGRSLTLRPELTAGVVRAVNEHGLARGALPVKLAYAGPMFRQERPQRGRYRQFTQVGIEALGAEDPIIDAEVIDVAVGFFSELGLATSLALNSIGHLDAGCRLGYHKVLVEFLDAHRDELAPEDRDRIESNPLRTFDSREPRTIEVMAGAPLISDHLCTDCRSHFEGVRGLLDDIGIGYELQPRLVRGLDYYTRTTFEFMARGLGSQDAVGGGGRYDGLSEALGGPPLTGIGFSLGVDRILLALGDAIEAGPAIEVYVVALGDAARREAFAIVSALRNAGIGADLDSLGRGMKGQMKNADRSGARFAAIVGDEELAAREVTLKDLESGYQERVPMDRLERRVRS